MIFMEDMLIEIGYHGFNGAYADGICRGQGPRRKFIHDILRQNGMMPDIDEYGNIWVFTGTTGEYALFSSHMDTDPLAGTSDIEFREDAYTGNLDNSVGCYLNLVGCLRKTDKRMIYIFTASEEENNDEGMNSAKDVVKTLETKGIMPRIVVAIDVTYPKLLIPADAIDKMSDDEWCNASAESMFDMNDLTHCYIDSVSSTAKEKAASLIRSYKNRDVKVRDLTGLDEAAVYGKYFPSFAFGPVCYGKFSEPGQRMPVINLKTAGDFMNFMAAEL